MMYILKGDPKALARPRFGKKKVYDSQRHDKLIAGIDIGYQHGDRPLYTGPLHLDVMFYMRIPKGKAKLNGLYHKSRPDFSNLLKYIEDLSTGVLFHDDCLIASVSGQKLYSRDPHVAFTIIELDKETLDPLPEKSHEK